MTDEVLVRMKHLRAAGICNRESRVFAERQGWSWQEFLDKGLPASSFHATGHHLAIRVARIAEDEARGR